MNSEINPNPAPTPEPDEDGPEKAPGRITKGC